MIAYRLEEIVEGQVLRVDCIGHSVVATTYDELLEFLCRDKTELHVVWSLSQFAPLVISVLPRKAVEQLEKKERNGYSATWEDNGWRYRIFYQPSKFFAINRRKTNIWGDCEVTFYELDQFFPDNPEEGE